MRQYPQKERAKQKEGGATPGRKQEEKRKKYQRKQEKTGNCPAESFGHVQGKEKCQKVKKNALAIRVGEGEEIDGRRRQVDRPKECHPAFRLPLGEQGQCGGKIGQRPKQCDHQLVPIGKGTPWGQGQACRHGGGAWWGLAGQGKAQKMPALVQ